MTSDVELTIEAVILIVVCGMTMAIMRYVDPNNDISKFYSSTNTFYEGACAIALQCTTTLIIMCFALNCRFLATMAMSSS